MPYVERNLDGNIVGISKHGRVGADEYISDGSAELQAFFNPPATIDDVKAEAYRRIVAIIHEWEQRNLTARAAELSKQVADGTPLTVDQQSEWDAGQAIWDQVKIIRSASDAIEADLGTMTVDEMKADTRWP